MLQMMPFSANKGVGLSRLQIRVQLIVMPFFMKR